MITKTLFPNIPSTTRHLSSQATMTHHVTQSVFIP